mgnify:CR=1 FL=1
MNGHKRPTVPFTEITGVAVTVIAMHQALAAAAIRPLPVPTMAVGSHFI